MIVYDVTPDGSILYMDANPDMSVSRGAWGPQVPKSDAWLGGGFKNFRPQKLEGAVLQSDGTYVGGHVVLAANDAIPDFSLEQYEGNVPAIKTVDAGAQFRYNNASLNLYEYARASMSNGGFAFNPVYELEVSLGSLCREANDKSRDADARVEKGFVTLYTDLTNDIASWKQRDLRVVYHGSSLKDALAETYAAQQQACVASADARRTNPLDRFAQQPAAIYIQRLIAQTYEPATFAEMQPVGQ
jgi:hypothetical protein